MSVVYPALCVSAAASLNAVRVTLLQFSRKVTHGPHRMLTDDAVGTYLPHLRDLDHPHGGRCLSGHLCFEDCRSSSGGGRALSKWPLVGVIGPIIVCRYCPIPRRRLRVCQGYGGSLEIYKDLSSYLATHHASLPPNNALNVCAGKEW